MYSFPGKIVSQSFTVQGQIGLLECNPPPLPGLIRIIFKCSGNSNGAIKNNISECSNIECDEDSDVYLLKVTDIKRHSFVHFTIRVLKRLESHLEINPFV